MNNLNQNDVVFVEATNSIGIILNVLQPTKTIKTLDYRTDSDGIRSPNEVKQVTSVHQLRRLMRTANIAPSTLEAIRRRKTNLY